MLQFPHKIARPVNNACMLLTFFIAACVCFYEYAKTYNTYNIDNSDNMDNNDNVDNIDNFDWIANIYSTYNAL